MQASATGFLNGFQKNVTSFQNPVLILTQGAGNFDEMKEMKKYQFKTNINCSGCVEKVTPFLQGQEITGWSVNTTDPRKVLTVETMLLTEKKIIDLVSNAGFKIEKLG